MFDEIQKAYQEIAQSRSDFQLAKFVIGQHPTPEMQYYQTLIELNTLITSLKIAEIDYKITEIKIKKLESKGDEISALKAEKERINQEQNQVNITAMRREIHTLIEAWNSFEHKFTREEIESNQFAYWKARLTNNADAMIMAGNTVNAAHIEAMQQAEFFNEYIEQFQDPRKELKN